LAGRGSPQARRLSPSARRERARVLPGAPFPKEFASSDLRKIFRRTFIEKSDRLANSRHNSPMSFLEGFRKLEDRDGR
jgi:hypothetical protein